MPGDTDYGLEHPHEPEVAPIFDDEGRCLICLIASLTIELEAWRTFGRKYVEIQAILPLPPESV